MEVEGCFGALGGVCSLPSTVRAFWAVGISSPALHQTCICGKGLPAEGCHLTGIWVIPAWI